MYCVNEGCGGRVVRRGGSGRLVGVLHGYRIAIPDDIETLTCEQCHETSLNLDEYRAIEARVMPTLLTWQGRRVAEMIQILQECHQVNIRAIEGAVGVPGTTFEKALKGQLKKPLRRSVLRLLEAYVSYPELFWKNLGEPPEFVIDDR